MRDTASSRASCSYRPLYRSQLLQIPEPNQCEIALPPGGLRLQRRPSRFSGYFAN